MIIKQSIEQGAQLTKLGVIECQMFIFEELMLKPFWRYVI